MLRSEEYFSHDLRKKLVQPAARMRGRVQRRGREAHIGTDARHQLIQPAKAQLRADVPALADGFRVQG